MDTNKRKSPVVFKQTVKETESRDNWEVVLTYEGEKDGPWLVDLSHKQRFDFQSSAIDKEKPYSVSIPDTPGSSVLGKQLLINRMNRTQCTIINLGKETLSLPDNSGYTDVSEATLFCALIGKDVFSICEKLTALDFMDTKKQTPFLLQGPFSHVPCQITTLNRDPENGCVLFSCSRGYARDMIHAVMDAGEEFGLTPAGEKQMDAFLENAG